MSDETKPPTSTAETGAAAPVGAPDAAIPAQPQSRPRLSTFAADLRGAALQLQGMAKEANSKRQDHLVEAAVNHLHEAGQWLEKARTVLEKAGV